MKFRAEQEQFAGHHIEPYVRDSRSGDIAFDREKVDSGALHAKLDGIAKDPGDAYIDGTYPIFDPRGSSPEILVELGCCVASFGDVSEGQLNVHYWR